MGFACLLLAIDMTAAFFPFLYVIQNVVLFLSLSLML